MAQPGAVALWPARWRRAGAFVIDVAILWDVTCCIAFFDFGSLSAAPLVGRAIGFAIGAAYFGILCSRLGGGATIGMRLLGLRVVSARGGRPRLWVSFGRAALIVAPIILYGAPFAFHGNMVLASIVAVPVNMLTFGLGFAQVCLLLFCRRTGRLAHDIPFQTAVVRVGAEAADLAPAGPAGRLAAWILAASGVAAVGLSIVEPVLLARDIQRLRPPAEAVRALPEVVRVRVIDEAEAWASVAGPWRKEYGLEINARLRRWPKDPQAEIDRIGAAAATTYRLSPGQIVRIQLYQEAETGFSVIWKSWMDYYEPPCPPPRGQGSRPAPADLAGKTATVDARA